MLNQPMSRSEMNTNHRSPRTFFVVMLALFVTLALGACETDQGETDVIEEDTPATGQQMPPAQQDTAQQGAVAAEEIEGDPSEYVGQTVRVEGEIAQVFDQNRFTLEGDWLGGNLLVVVPQGVTDAGMTFNEGDNIQVSGMVREYIETDIEEEYGFDPGVEIEYEEQEPVVVAENVTAGQATQPAE